MSVSSTVRLSDQLGSFRLIPGVNYSFGFVDPVARPAPTVGGWLRHVQPLLIFPDYTVSLIPSLATDLMTGECLSGHWSRKSGR